VGTLVNLLVACVLSTVAGRPPGTCNGYCPSYRASGGALCLSSSSTGRGPGDQGIGITCWCQRREHRHGDGHGGSHAVVVGGGLCSRHAGAHQPRHWQRHGSRHRRRPDRTWPPRRADTTSRGAAAASTVPCRWVQAAVGCPHHAHVRDTASPVASPAVAHGLVCWACACVGVCVEQVPGGRGGQRAHRARTRVIG